MSASVSTIKTNKKAKRPSAPIAKQEAPEWMPERVFKAIKKFDEGESQDGFEECKVCGGVRPREGVRLLYAFKHALEFIKDVY